MCQFAHPSCDDALFVIARIGITIWVIQRFGLFALIPVEESLFYFPRETSTLNPRIEFLIGILGIEIAFHSKKALVANFI